MPGLDRGEYDIAAGDLRTPPGPSSVPCSASGMAAATCLIASGTHFAIPRLNGIPPRHQMSFGVQPAARLGLSLLEAGIADPSDWLRDNDAIEFIEKTLRRWALKNGGEEISTEFDLALALVSDLEPYAESPNAAIAQDMYIVLEPETAGYVVLGPVLREMNKLHGRLPITFLNLFTTALNRWVRTYDYRDAEDRVETLREWYEGDPEGEQVELPDVKGATPQFLRHRKPLQESFVVKLAERARDKRLREILRGVLQLSATSRRAQRPEIGPEASDRLADSNPPLPALLAVFEKQDAIEGCFDEESQGMMECPPEPNVIIPLKIADVDGVKTAFGIAEVVCDVLTQASRLIKLIMANVN
ncbi:MAG TPA: hypothetical protein VKX49_10230 [Bryobacteraceae bacterium]|nr:hypothetical protein [Bryobacteraceae bacterium]